ncbi:MAG: FixH family protein [Deltaproteobacteria bacterium]|jgi:nitrogen fixation protein FixH|nr:FixH family protein [Deltaproteobacteria bacterium]MBW2510529.1 FixH family protein [Deltaproteobacteria bacterium]MDH4007345.1 FixH family protein [Desulfuromonadales bacterium]
MKRTNLYPIFILLMIGSFIGFLAWSAMRASDSGPQVTDADYYSKGLRYTSTVLEKRAAAVLGWRIDTQLSGRTLRLHLSDKEGQPVSSAKGVIAIYMRNWGETISFPLQEVSAGTYQMHLTDSMTGEMTARVEFERDGARLNRQLLLNL